MKTYTFKDGHQITSKLSCSEILKRMDRLDWLRVMTEGYEEDEGHSICEKALRAYNKTNNFTGVIRLTNLEKDFLAYMLENNDDKKDIEVIKFYLR